MRHFSHQQFQHFEFEAIPRDRDVYLMDEKWMAEWEANYLGFFNGKEFEYIGYISHAAVRSATPESVEISWYPNVMDRFHEVVVVLPREAFVACVNVYDYDEKPHIFVKYQWLTSLHTRPYSAFALIDAIGVKSALETGQLTCEKLLSLRNRIDEVADLTPKVAFVSFADSLLLKVNWFVGHVGSNVRYSYEPEALIQVIPKVAYVFREVLGMSIYATITQGVNEYADAGLIHRSSSDNHISLNSLGLPFAQLLAIDEAARSAIKSSRHSAYELYVDELFFHSLRFKPDFDKHAQPNAPYRVPMSSSPGKYYCTKSSVILENLDANRSL